MAVLVGLDCPDCGSEKFTVVRLGDYGYEYKCPDCLWRVWLLDSVIAEYPRGYRPPHTGHYRACRHCGKKRAALYMAGSVNWYYCDSCKSMQDAESH